MSSVDWSRWNSREDNFAKYRDVPSELIYGKPSDEVPEVSIMIVAYRYAAGLRRALDSALQQDYEGAYEIAVVDDSGNPHDEEVDELMKEYCARHENVIYYRNVRNIGVLANLNRACELCRTKWYSQLHHDDEMLPDCISNYMRICERISDLGLIGSYMEIADERDGKQKKRLIDRFVELFIRLRRGKPIQLGLPDNLRYIYLNSQCLFINREKYKEIGGCSDEYYPSGDFALVAKMSCYHKSVFLPSILFKRGIGENASLKQSVCDASIIAAYNMSLEIAKALNMGARRQIRKASIAAVIGEVGVRGYNDVDYSDVKARLGMKKIYNRRAVILFINLYSKICWGMLLFRKNALNN